MQREFNRVAVLGLGKVGELVALLLQRSGFDVVGFDATLRDGLTVPAQVLDVSDAAALSTMLSDFDAVFSALPFFLNQTVADVAAASATHYFDLTEDVPTTNHIMQLAEKNSELIFAPQCGLAPGIVGIIGASIAATFDSLRSIELKVGALPQNPVGLLGYSFNWSTDGLVNEYINDAEVVRAGKRQIVPSLTEDERVLIGGVPLEASLTSGGLGTMTHTYEGKLDRLDYKTMRYPGHFQQIRFLLDELHLRDKRDVLGPLLYDAKPPVNDDIVYLHAAVEGVKNGAAYRENRVYSFTPIEIDGCVWRAISWTTAASAVAVVELAAAGKLGTGFIKQESISLTDLFATTAGELYVQQGATA